MKVVSIGDIKYDCTYDYDVELKYNTVEYLVEQILKRTKEHGTIYINNKRFEYRYGRMINSISEFSASEIKSITANGGYSLMSYDVKV